MNSLPALTLVLAKIAGEVRTPNGPAINTGDNEDDGASTVIASLTKSLNSGDQTSSDDRVLDSASSLMCLKTTEVCNARIKCLVETMITVLDSSISCKILLLGREGPEFLQVGSSISFGDGRDLVRVGADMLENLQTNSGFVHPLLYAFLRTAVSSSIYQVPFIWSSMRDQETETAGISRRTAIASLTRFSSDKIYSSDNETPLRLLLWHLDPLLFKNDISEVLRETMERPFLSLEAEFYNRPTWRNMILCLVTSPAMFRQASILLHNWFLRTGVTFVLELQIALVSAVLDMISRPMTWGISMEMGLKYPFVHAYFPSSSQKLLAILTGSISRNSFIDLVHCIKMEVTGAEASMDPSICYSSFRHETILNWIDNNSTWSMLMKFRIWFYFAIMLIFYYKNIQDLYISEVISNDNSFDSANDEELNKAAILYLSFVLNPVDKGHGVGVGEHLLRISRSWPSTVSAFSCHKEGSFLGSSHNKISLSWNKKFSINMDYDGKLASWLRKFDDVCVKSWTKSFLSASVDSKCEGKNFSTTSKRLFNQIPLGILILYPGIVSDRGCELLLFYATTGEIVQSGGHEISSCLGSGGRKWAVDGVCLVFSIFDIVEEMSVMLFDCESTRLDFICHLKGKVCKYLLRCVEILLHHCILSEIGGRVGLLDLFRRLIRWKQQGREVFEGYEVFNDVVDDFAKKFSVSKELGEEI